MLKKLIDFICITVALSGALSAFSPIAFAQQDEDKSFLLLYFKEEELVVESPTRGSKPLTQAAENITVVTAEEIRLLNAHTVADVLKSVTGVQVFLTGGPGSIASASIQGSDSRHVAVFMDGIPLNNLGDNVTDIGSLPVQNIEKIELIKGPASSAWGSSLGGVVNIITKSGATNEKGGTLSASYGERNTGDFRVEAFGKQDRLGYYIDAGRLQTDGFRPHNDFSGNNAYAKLMYSLTENTRALFAIGYDRLSRDIVEVPGQDLLITNHMETLKSAVSLNSSLSADTELSIAAWQLHRIFDFHNGLLSSGAEFSKNHYDDNGYGSSAKLIVKHGHHNAVLGADYDTSTLESNTISGNKQRRKKRAFFANDTVSFDRLSFTPGIRYDNTDTNGDFTSPSLGVTYKFPDATLLRVYAARGFSIPPFASTFGDNQFYQSNPGLKMERVWSYQLGAETAALRYLWLRVSAFRHDIRDVISNETLSATSFISVNKGRQRRQGLEIEARTTPLYHISLTAGAAYLNTRDLDNGQTVPNVPQRTYDLGLVYDNETSFKALLKGHSIYWNSDPLFEGNYDNFIFDLHLSRTLYARDKKMLDVFADINNIFNASQYPFAIYRNPERWIEAGLRYAF